MLEVASADVHKFRASKNRDGDNNEVATRSSCSFLTGGGGAPGHSTRRQMNGKRKKLKAKPKLFPCLVVHRSAVLQLQCRCFLFPHHEECVHSFSFSFRHCCVRVSFILEKIHFRSLTILLFYFYSPDVAHSGPRVHTNSGLPRSAVPRQGGQGVDGGQSWTQTRGLPARGESGVGAMWPSRKKTTNKRNTETLCVDVPGLSDSQKRKHPSAPFAPMPESLQCSDARALSSENRT